MLSASGKDLQDNADMVATRITMALSAAIKSYIDADKDDKKLVKDGIDVTVTIRPKAEVQGDVRDLPVEDAADVIPSSPDSVQHTRRVGCAVAELEREDAPGYRACLVCECYEPFQ